MTRQEQKLNTVSRTLFWFVLVIIAACDPFGEDDISKSNLLTFGQREYYILPGTSALIDLNSVVRKSFINATIKISKEPQQGQLFPLEMMALKYQPSKHFTAGTDRFVFSVLQDGEIINSDTIHITIKETTEDFPCGTFAIDDYAVGRINSTITIRILENDRICGVERLSLIPSIFIQPKHGEVAVKGDSIVYVPESGFLGKDSLAYRVSTADNQSDENRAASHGIVNVTVLDNMPGGGPAECFEWLDAYIIDLTDTEVDKWISTNTCGTGYDFHVFKGLENCSEPQLSIGPFLKNPGGFCFGEDGQVLYVTQTNSPRNAVAQLRICIDDVCKDVVLRMNQRSTDPEKTPGWTLLETGAGTESYNLICFVDELTGYIAGQTAMRKTTDGGKSWVSLPFKIPSKKDARAYLWGLDFLNADNGYAGYSLYNEDENFGIASSGGVMRTTDGGHNWAELAGLENYYVYAVEFIDTELGFVGVHESWEGGVAFILKTTDGGLSWRRVLELERHSLPKIQFIKSGAVGYVLYVETIYRTVDYGETWDAFFTDVRYDVDSEGNPISSEYHVQVPDFALATTSEILIANPTTPYQSSCDLYRSEEAKNWSKVQTLACGQAAISPGGSLGIHYSTSAYIPTGERYEQQTFISTDGANTWRELNVDPKIVFSHASVPSEDVIYLLGMNGKVLRYVRE